MIHDKITRALKTLDYESDEKGVCFGIAYMGMQAVLLKDIETFNKRIERIDSEEFAKEIIKYKQMQKKLTNAEELAEDEEKFLTNFADIRAFF